MKLKMKPLMKTAKVFLTKHAPEILTGIGVVGMIATPIMAVKATPAALKAIEADSRKNHDDDPHAATKGEMVKSAWRYYVPSVVTGGMSIACVVGASAVNLKRNAALATAYALSESALKEYKENVLGVVGEKKEEEIRDRIAGNCIKDNPVDDAMIIDTHEGNTLCLDSFTGRYFKSSIESLRKAANEVNRQMLYDDTASMNDFYDAIGLPTVDIGEELGWSVQKGYIDLDFSTQLTRGGEPCLVVSHGNRPFAGFRHYQ